MRIKGKKEDEAEKKRPEPRKSGKGKGSFGLLLTLFFAILTIGFYYSSTIRPEKYWLAGFTGFMIPPAIIIQCLFLAYWLWKKPFFALIPMLALFLGMRFIRASFGWHYLITEKCREFKVLSLNAKAFSAMQKDTINRSVKVPATLDAIIASDADILCIQEMYDFPGVQPFSIIRRLKKAGYPHVFFSVAEKSWGSSIGMAIFSKHPILEKQTILKTKKSNNQIILARIKIGERRISVINMHLQSVALKDGEIHRSIESEEWMDKSLSVGKKLKKGFQIRARQLDELLKAAEEEGDYVLICGDLNDTPYSNSYLRLRDRYENAFERQGKGFGFTFNGEIPFLRIDQQFYGKGLVTNRFDTRRNFPSSDHNGTEACYFFKE